MSENMRRRKSYKIFEKIKTVIIVVLCLSCAYLMYSITNLQGRISGNRNLSWFSGGITEKADVPGGNGLNALTAFSVLSKPETIMINATNSRHKISPDNNLYNTILETINAAIKSMYNSASEITVLDSFAEWDNAIKLNSIYIKYPCLRQTSFESQFYGINSGTLVKNIDKYSELLMVFPASGDSIIVMIPSENGIIKIKTNVAAGAINEIINSQKPEDKKTYSFASELNLDKTVKDNKNNAAELKRTLIIPSVDETYDNILLEVPWLYKNGISLNQTTEFMLGLIDVFGYNHNTIRQYSDMNGVLVFVADTGTIKAYPDGKLEYKALTKKDGILLTSKANDAYNTTSGLMDVLRKIYYICFSEQENGEFDLRFSLLPKTEQSDEMKFEIDYFFDGIRVDMGNEHAAVATVNSGMLTELKMNLKTIKRTDGKTQSKPLFEAIDEFCVKNPMNKKIMEAQTVYRANENGNEICAEWEIKGTQEW